MDPHALIDSATAGAPPAPLWFVHFFKVLGFTLHMVPMNLWYAGILVAMLLYLGGGEHGRRFAARLMAQMPVILAIGINFGIVPLLFMQLAYAPFFYPATILMAWFWLAIIGLLILAYYGVYVYAMGLRADGTLRPLRRAVGWTSVACFMLIGFLFANGLSLTDHVERWAALWQEHSTGGAALGTALNLSDPTLWPRWLLMFGLALTTTAAWMLVDAAWLARKDSDDYRAWVSRTAPKLYTLGMIWFAVAGSWYVFGTWSSDLRQAMFGGWLLPLTVVTAAAPGFPWIVMLLAGRRGLPIRTTAMLVALGQVGVLGLNAVSRQIVQTENLRAYFRWPEQPVAQWSPMVLFLATFVVGLAVVAWMIVQAVKASARPVES